jgi:NADH:ubiquinone oxidoreductase subunit 4 (subunit M)
VIVVVLGVYPQLALDLMSASLNSLNQFVLATL